MSNYLLSAEDIKFVDSLARHSGKLALEMRAGVGVRQKTSPTDLVTDADLTISQFLVAALQDRFPDDLIVSEEQKHPVGDDVAKAKLPDRIWLIDPIDGTENYVKQDGQYSTMIGLLHQGVPYYGWIFQPTEKRMFHGGPDFGAWKQVSDGEPTRYTPLVPLPELEQYRLMMGWGDRKKHPWVCQLPKVRFVDSDSLGLKIMKILENEADLFLSLTGRVKLWDTAAPAAIALGAGLDVATAEGTQLPYPVPSVSHGTSVIIGRPGSISWALQNIKGHVTQTSR